MKRGLEEDDLVKLGLGEVLQGFEEGENKRKRKGSQKGEATARRKRREIAKEDMLMLACLQHSKQP